MFARAVSLSRSAVLRARSGVRFASTSASSSAAEPIAVRPYVLGAAAAAAAGTAGYYMLSQNTSHASMADEGLHPPKYPWPHNGIFSTYDHAAIRRGFQVYQEVCAACHALNFIAYRNLVGVSHTEEEVKAIAAEADIVDGPNDEGEMFTRPGKLSDSFPAPYPNEEAARAANGGAFPPDLSLVVKARHAGPDYVFALLTGYQDPPAGIELREGLNYNPYFPGGAISMARLLFDDLVEYEDGTPATTSQMAKDVTTFLAWASEPELEERKLYGLRALLMLGGLTLMSVWLKRYKWASLKNRKLVWAPPRKH